MLAPNAVENLATWVNERHAIYMRKAWLTEQPGQRMSRRMVEAWGHGGWSLDQLTDDPVILQYRFCNVFRELDRVTVWIRENIREPYADHPHLWFMLAVARYINWPPTLQELIGEIGAWPSIGLFRPENMTDTLETRRRRGDKVETGAYMIRAESDPKAPWYGWSKQRYVSEVVLGKLWEHRASWEHRLSGRGGQPDLKGTWECLQDPHYTGWGPFMAYQVVVDLRHTRYLRGASDINSWAAVGPGSRRGLNRLHDRPVGGALRQEAALAEMLEVREVLARPGMLAPWVPLPDLSDVQNCLCEYDKWQRVRLGEGRPRAMYVPGRGW